jgi:small subunit ribosomal protein S15
MTGMIAARHFPGSVYCGPIASVIAPVLYSARREKRRKDAEALAARSMLTQADKKEIAESNRLHASDTGSADVQIALLTERIRQLTEHLRVHRKDHHSQRGLMKIVGRRRRLLRYISRREPERYKSLIARLGIRK